MKKRNSSQKPIASIFYGDFQGRKVVKTNRGVHPESVVLHCVDHMRHDKYSASLAEVHDDRTGTVHAVVKRNVSGEAISILYSSVEPKDD